MDLYQCFMNFLTKSLLLTKKQELIFMQYALTNDYQRHYTSKLLENFKNVKLSFRDTTLDTDLADMQLISKRKQKNSIFKCVVDVFSK